jgi:hypothetical protein
MVGVVSFPSTAERLSFFGMSEDAPAANTTRPRADTVSGSSPTDRGPARFHRVHGAIRVGEHVEMRITTQLPHEGRPARLVVRVWQRRPDGNWWPDAGLPGVWITSADAEDFAKAVNEAARRLAAEARGAG